MNEIIVHIINGKESNAVTAKALYDTLWNDRRKNYKRWANRVILGSLFVEGTDYIIRDISTQNESKLSCLSATTKHEKVMTDDYILTIEMAKHLAMMADNEEGMKVRQYFIDTIEQQALELEEMHKSRLEIAHQFSDMFRAKSGESNRIIHSLSSLIQQGKTEDALEYISGFDYAEKILKRKLSLDESKALGIKLKTMCASSNIVVLKETTYHGERNIYPKFMIDAYFYEELT